MAFDLSSLFTSSDADTAPSVAPDTSSATLFDFPASGPGSSGGGGGMLQPWGGGKGTYTDPLAFAPPDQGFDWMKLLPAAIPAATGLAGYFMNQGGAADKALKNQAAATQPLQTAGNQQLQQFQAGNVGPNAEAQLELYRKQRTAQLEQQAANSGIPVGSMESDFKATVDREVMAMRNQMLQQEWSNAQGSTQIAASNLTNLARQQMLADAQQRQEWAEFMKQMGQLGGDIFSKGGIWESMTG
jgi:hypothetical protein